MKIRNLILASMIFAGAVYAGENSANKFTLDAKILRENIGKKSATLQGESEILSLTLKAVGEDNATKLEAVGCKISTHTKTIYFVKIPASKLDALAALPEVEVIDCTREMTLDMDLSKQAINAETVTALNSGTPDNIIAGEGVLVGVFDTGIDIFHPDFSDDNGIRLQYFWDMSRKGTEPPEGYDWGAEYTKDYLDNNIQNMSTVDGVGHGTHVTGTIAGGGIEDPAFRGIAYNADIISVKGVREDDQKSFSNADVIAGCQYIVSKAKELGKPVVINLSLGSTFASGHDGTDLEAQAINELAEPGVLFAIAAGNDGGEGYHAGTKMSVGKKVAMPIAPRNMKDEGIFAIAEYMNTSGFFSTGGDVWYDAGVIDSLSISFFKTANLTYGSEISVPDAKMSFSVKDKDFSNAMVRDASGSVISYVNLVQEREDPISHAGNSRIYIHNAGRSSINLRDYVVCISTTGKGEGYLDMWAGYAAYQEQYPLNLDDTEVLWGDYMQQVSSPGTADSAICVGAFTTKNKWVNEDGIEIDQYYNHIGGITYFSSRGPSRDRRILPVISAPGQTIFSTRSSTMNENTLRGLQSKTLESEYYIGMDGTSMATPHIAGTLALMLQINPKLSAKEACDILRATATTDEFTGETPNNAAGSGKVDVQKVINYMLGASAKDYVMANDVKVYPMPANAEINVDLDAISLSNSGDLLIVNSIGARQDVPFELNGGKLKLNISSLASGIYAGEYRTGETVSRFKFVKK